MPPRRSEAGFTVVELLVVTLIGGIVMTALLTMVDATQRASTRVSQRVDSAQRGRIAMEQITQALRSQVCIDAEPSVSPIAEAEATRLVFYAALPRKVAGEAKPSEFMPERRVLRYEAADGGRIIEEVSAGTGTYPNVTFPAVTSQRVLVDKIVPRGAGGALFSYWRLAADGTVSQAPMTTPLNDQGRESVVRIDIEFAARPASGAPVSGTDASHSASVAVRLPTRTDKDNPGNGPTCML